MECEFAHNSHTLSLEFASDSFEGNEPGGESWGLDNVRITARPRK